MLEYFSLSEVIHILELDVRQCLKWKKHRYIYPSIEKTFGKKQVEIYTRWDVYGVKIFEILLNQMAFDTEFAREFYNLWQMFPSLLQPPRKS